MENHLSAKVRSSSNGHPPPPLANGNHHVSSNGGTALMSNGSNGNGYHHPKEGDDAVFDRVRTLFDADSAEEPRIDDYLSQIARDFLLGSQIFTSTIKSDELLEKFGRLSATIPTAPQIAEEYFENLANTTIAKSTRVGAPRQIGHMTTALPYFHRPLSKLVTAMNQNAVKTETASMVTFLEREVIGMMHRSFYHNDEAYYDRQLIDPEATLGCLTTGGTLCNITAMWCARNSRLGPDPSGEFRGIEREGLVKAMMHYGYSRAVIVGSENMHYSLIKAVDMLGIGLDNVIRIPVDETCRVQTKLMEEKIKELQSQNTLVLAIVGIAGATETGAVDDLKTLSGLAAKYDVHFHVDAAWGGPMVFSSKLAPLLDGIHLADTITVDGHKQLYTPMGCALVLFKNAMMAKSIRKTANYIIRQNSFDAGKHTPEGSRPAAAIYLHASLSLIGANGIGRMIERNSELALRFAETIFQSLDFELIVRPMSNIFLYRWLPQGIRQKAMKHEITPRENEVISKANEKLQVRQSERDQSFVSRTTFRHFVYELPIVVLRVVISNPLTTWEDIEWVLQEQRAIAQETGLNNLFLSESA